MTQPTHTSEQCVEWLDTQSKAAHAMFPHYRLEELREHRAVLASCIAHLTPPATPGSTGADWDKELHIHASNLFAQIKACMECNETHGFDDSNILAQIIYHFEWVEKQVIDRLRAADLAKDKDIERLREALEHCDNAMYMFQERIKEPTKAHIDDFMEEGRIQIKKALSDTAQRGRG